MQEVLKPNSYKSKQAKAEAEEKKIEKVVHGKVKTRKKSEVSKFKDIFIAEDAANVKSYVFMDVLVPAIKKAIGDIVCDGINMILYGDTKHSGSRGSSNASYVSYRSYSDRGRDSSRRYSSSRRSDYDLDDIILDTRGDAEDVLDRMSDLVSDYGIVKVADLYDLIGESCDYTANNYGWTSMRNARVIRVRDGYRIDLPRPMAID